nr:toll/interleukin-1 receptor domain-containing protein [Anaerolineae bacterium]
MNTPAYSDDDHEMEEIEAYCVRCKEHTVMLNPTAVWTRRGAPGTRGECEMCGTTVFRMGRTDAHRGLVQPDVSQFSDISSSSRKGLVNYATFINFAGADSPFAERLSDDLTKTGIPTWLHTESPPGEVEWASGVHPALEECDRMVLVLSRATFNREELEDNWRFFQQRRKPVVIAQVEHCKVPDDLRRSPRFDFSEDYKSAFRELVQKLSTL